MEQDTRYLIFRIQEDHNREITEGVHVFDPSKQTCLQSDWSKHEIGYLLLQKPCSCEPTNSLLCFPEG